MLQFFESLNNQFGWGPTPPLYWCAETALNVYRPENRSKRYHLRADNQEVWDKLITSPHARLVTDEVSDELIIKYQHYYWPHHKRLYNIYPPLENKLWETVVRPDGVRLAALEELFQVAYLQRAKRPGVYRKYRSLTSTSFERGVMSRMGVL